MDSVEVEIARLRATVEGGFKELDRRIGELQQTGGRIETEVRATNGRVTRHDEQIKTLFSRVRQQHQTEEERSGYTKRDLAMFLGGGAALVVAWKFVEWAINVMRLGGG